MNKLKLWYIYLVVIIASLLLLPLAIIGYIRNKPIMLPSSLGENKKVTKLIDFIGDNLEDEIL